jgi:integrase
MGRRDELVIRLGLAGVRAQEIVGLEIGNLRDLDTDHPTLYWTGKRYKPLHIALGPQTVDSLRRYLNEYRELLRNEPPADARLICRRRPGRTAKGDHHRIEYGAGLAPGANGRAAIWNIVTGAARRAGLGHVSPHDLRRSAAGILHREKGEDGSHRFDLLDIQKVLHHADPVTTMKCYLDPMDTEVMDRAAKVLD